MTKTVNATLEKAKSPAISEKKVDDRAYSEVRAGKRMKIEWPRNFCLFLEGPDGEMSDLQPWSGI